MAESYALIFLAESAAPLSYTSLSGRSRKRNLPMRQRDAHAARLERQWAQLWEEAQAKEQARKAVALSTKNGTYIQIEGQAGYDLMVKSLENLPAGIRLGNVQRIPTQHDASLVVRATLYVPVGQERHWLKKIRQYAEEETKKGRPKNQPLIESIESIRLAVVDSFWVGPPDAPPSATAAWCEIWLRDDGDADVEVSFRDLARQLGITLQEHALRFPERLVLLALVNGEQLAQLVESSDRLAEFRRLKETARFFLELDNRDQTRWVQNLRARVAVVADPKVAITVLDRGVNNGHLLLEPILKDADCHAVKAEWDVVDDDGHGTLMCGLAGYGDLQAYLEGSQTIEIHHCLESVKILPPKGKNDPQLYGYVTSQAISRAEISAPHRHHIACMAVTTEDGLELGRPSSWSAAIDQLCFGQDDELPRLFIVAAGNVEPESWSRPDYVYPDSNLKTSIHDPGQSWNALTVGAYTQKARLTDPLLADHKIVAAADALSPFSTTSTTWDTKRWPAKPDIVVEGGNLMVAPDGFLSEHDDLRLLSTGHQPTRRQLDDLAMTSAATAQAAWMAAQIQVAYPQAWPETVRGLLVHSAQWTDEMKRQFLSSQNKGDYARLLRICGYGVPNLDRALHCYQNHLTLIAQEMIQPFETIRGKSNPYVTKDMNLHELPWPNETLVSLGDMQVTMRVTLSYFIEPSPGEVGWDSRYRYASHALRFTLKRIAETKQDFQQRINKEARDEEYDKPTQSDRHPWTIGAKARHMGSVHSDIWSGNAADLATCDMIGVYPVIGWWRERPWLNKVNEQTRYSLIVSIHTPETGIDIYTPVATKLRIPISV